MQKKYYISPTLNVIRMQNDIIATSSPSYGGSNRDKGINAAEAPSRYRKDFGLSFDDDFKIDYGL